MHQGFHIALAQAAAALQGVDLAARAAALGLPAPGPDGALAVPAFGTVMRVGPPAFECIDTATNEPARHAEAILVLHFLACPHAYRETGEAVSFRDLPAGSFYWGPFQGRALAPLARRIGNDLALLRERLDRFPWEPLPLGDLGARVAVLGPVTLTLVYRAGDEEFGPAADLLFDRAIVRALPTEDAAVLAEVFTRRLTR